MTVRLQIMPHAVEQFRRRWAPDASEAEARAELEEGAADAAPTKERTPKGDEIWRSGEVRLVVKRDGGGAAPVVVTVLPREDRHSGQLPFVEEDDAGGTRRMLEWSLRDAERETKDRLEALRVANQAYDASKRHEAEVRARVSSLPSGEPEAVAS